MGAVTRHLERPHPRGAADGAAPAALSCSHSSSGLPSACWGMGSSSPSPARRRITVNSRLLTRAPVLGLFSAFWLLILSGITAGI